MAERNLIDPPSGQGEPPVEEIPQTLRDKGINSIDQLASSYLESEKRLGQMRSELGQMRQMSTPVAAPPSQSVTADDFFEDPKSAVQRLVAEQLAPAKEAGFNDFMNTKHAGWKDVVETPEFSEYIMKSKARQRLFVDASNYDRDAADELISNFNALHEGDNSRRKEIDKEIHRDRIHRDAVTESGSARQTSRKIYDSQWVRELRNSNPLEYERQMNGDLGQAYREGRVREKA